MTTESRTVEQLKSIMADSRLHLRLYPTGRVELWINDVVAHEANIKQVDPVAEEAFRQAIIDRLGLTETEFNLIEAAIVAEDA